MKAVILAAGQGTRLSPLTRNKPKCLIRAAGRPIIDYLARALLENGISQLIIVAGYRADAVAEWVERLNDSRVFIVVNEAYFHTNNMFSFNLARAFLAGNPYILANGDVVTRPEIIRDFLSDPRPNLIVSEPNSWNEESMKTVLNQDAYLCDISKSIPPEISYGLSCDIYKFSPETGGELLDKTAQYIEKDGILDKWTEVALQELMQSGRIRMEPFNISKGNWLEIDDFNDLIRADGEFSTIGTGLPKIKAVFSDLDGTIFLGDQPIPGAAEAVSRLKKREIPVFFISNNSSSSHQDYVRKLADLGITADEKDIILSTDGLVDFLVSRGITKTWTIGTASMRNILESNGLKTESPDPEYVLLGYDTELTYEKLRRGTVFLNRGVPLLATHPDRVCPTPEGPIPDIGSILQILTSATGVHPEKIFGKPNPEMLVPTLQRLGIRPEEAVVVGDRLYTDMDMARAAGCRSVLVLTGETDRIAAEAYLPAPDLIVPGFGSLS